VYFVLSYYTTKLNTFNIKIFKVFNGKLSDKLDKDYNKATKIIGNDDLLGGILLALYILILVKFSQDSPYVYLKHTHY